MGVFPCIYLRNVSYCFIVKKCILLYIVKGCIFVVVSWGDPVLMICYECIVYDNTEGGHVKSPELSIYTEGGAMGVFLKVELPGSSVS